MNRIPSVPNIPVLSKPERNFTYGELRQKCDKLQDEVRRLQDIVDHQHAIILSQQPMMAHLQWEASKWQHFKRIMEKEQGTAAVAEAEHAVQQRMAGLI
ncbi:MAG: hypothetical protein RL156_1761 [Bacteroidota bacterium]|jgi:hypothetical protein